MRQLLLLLLCLLVKCYSWAQKEFLTIPSASHAAIHADDCVRNLAHRFLSFPASQVTSPCIAERGKIVFLTNDLYGALKSYQ